MASLRTKVLLEQIEDPSVESALRSVNDVLVDPAVETIAKHVVSLERRNRELEELFTRMNEILEPGGEQ